MSIKAMYREINIYFDRAKPKHILSVTDWAGSQVRLNSATNAQKCYQSAIALLVAPIFGLIYHTVRASQSFYKGDRERSFAHLKAAGTDLAVGVVVFGVIFLTCKLILALPAAFANTGGAPRIL